MIKVSALLSITCFVLAGSLLFYAQKISANLPRQIVYERPVLFEKGYRRTDSFTVDVRTIYGVGLLCNRTMPLEKLESILKNEVDVDYTISCGTQIVARGSSSEWGGESITQTDMTSYIGTYPYFTAEPTKTYTLEVTVNNTIPSLENTNGRVIVEGRDVAFWEGAGLNGLLTASLGTLFGVFGLLGVVPVIVDLVIKRLKSPNRK